MGYRHAWMLQSEWEILIWVMVILVVAVPLLWILHKWFYGHDVREDDKTPL